MNALVKSILPLPEPSALSAIARDVIDGLSATPKKIPPKYFYDNEGSHLFEQIAQLPEYYPTRAEMQILQNHAADIAKWIKPGAALIEFGSGACVKVRILLDAAPQLAAYVPVDISGDFLESQAAQLRQDYPKLAIHPVTADFTKAFAVPDVVKTMPRVGFFPGSTIGNFEPHEACAFLRQAREILEPGAVLIIGVDLVKDPQILHRAYNDKKGVTKKFNLNLLTRLNRELDANFNLASFEHHAFYNRERHRIEMHLASMQRQKVRVGGTTIEFRAGETIHTENSYKYSLESFGALARGAGWSSSAVWTDPEKLFSVHALTAN